MLSLYIGRILISECPPLIVVIVILPFLSLSPCLITHPYLLVQYVCHINPYYYLPHALMAMMYVIVILSLYLKLIHFHHILPSYCVLPICCVPVVVSCVDPFVPVYTCSLIYLPPYELILPIIMTVVFVCSC